MPCSDSSSSISIKLDSNERFLTFDFAKITCGSEIKGENAFKTYIKGKTLEEILNIPFAQLQNDLKINEDEKQFVLYMEWDAFRSAIVQYLGIEEGFEDVDRDRCQITSIDYTPEGVDIALVILPPKELPKILPCSLAKKLNN